MYKPVDPRVDFPRMEEQILSFWDENQIFKQSISQREGQDEFVFYDGPPFATGLPHYGHILAGTIKDIIPRYQAMKGKKVERRFGWDCHGLPVEYEMEKELGISGKSQIEEYGVAKFNEACRSIVLRFTEEWRDVVTRMGRWVDFDDDYKTMDPDYMETIWWVFGQLWEKGFVYEGYYILPYSPALATPLSNFEVNLGGYHDVTDPAITVRFELVDEPGTFILAWTTTPWTLPSNLGLALGPDIDYVKVSDGGNSYILGKDRLSAYYKDESEYTIEWTKKGSELKGLHYKPLFPYFADLDAKGAFRTHAADYVTTEDGTGIVHIAPGFGEDDYNVLKDTELPVPVPIDAECRFTSEVSDFEGLFVKDADKPIIARLREDGSLVKRENYLHPYPFCYRTNKPLIYRAVGSWFVDIEKVKQSMINANSRINWVPEHLKEGRFGKWLEGARDWAISRNRFWGNPIPIWKCDGSDYTECIGSREELEKKSGRKVSDLHKHFVDDITWPSPDGKGTMRRVPEVLDCWFESGAMPYAQNHYPFENKEWFEGHYPAEFIAEGLDQTRGWFYTLTVLAAALFDKPAFNNVIVNGIILAPDGKKMSKSLRNYTPPMDVMNEFGADALRLSLMHSTLVKAEDLRYSDDTVRDVLKSIIIPYWNAYSFFVTYANIDGVSPGAPPASPGNPLDRWILSEAERLVEDVTAQLDGYDLQRAIDPIVHYIDLLNNWYIRRSRRRFWRSENDADKAEAYATLHSVLMKLTLVAAPIVPFVTEEIYSNLREGSAPTSVHLCDYPVADRSKRDFELEEKMAVTQQAVSMGRAIRSMHNLKIRQPLKAIHLVTRESAEKRILIEMEDIIREELNVKEVVFRENEEELVEYSAKANFRKLGKELGKDMREAAARIEELSGREIQGLLEGTVLNMDVAGRSLDLTQEDVIIQRTERENLKVLNEGSLTVALDPEITDELRQEGLVRDLIRQVQNLRKESGLDVSDRIRLTLSGSDELRAAVESNEEYLMGETLARSIEWAEPAGGKAVSLGEIECTVGVEKAP
ncbi:MAG TPA: isoleucine--tRNA ligase [Spirochaetia bacterium]|nr:isoleucine--tRNA ligase [Spirochaetia bacterium]